MQKVILVFTLHNKNTGFMKTNTFVGMIMLLISMSILNIGFCQQSDILLYNGKIFTSDTARLYANALAIKGNKILAVGSNDAIAKLAGNKTKRINLQGKTVVPGFNDAHDHLGFFAPVGKFFTAGFSIQGPDKQAVLDSVKRLARSAAPRQWIVGPVGLTALQDTGMREALDSISPNLPVCLQVMWGHGIVLNTKALRMVGIADDEPDPLGGWYARKAGSRLITGALYEYAQWPVWHKVWISEPQHLVEGLRTYAQEQVQHGITTVQDMSCNIEPATLNHIFRRAKLPQRIRIIPMPGTLCGARNLSEWKQVDPRPAPLTYVSGIKYLIDGTPWEEAALFRQPYAGKADWYGRTDMPLDTIKQILKEAYTGNTQLMMHIVGDSAMSIVLSLMKQTGNDTVWRSKRVRFEHNQNAACTGEEIQMIKEMGIIMAHTPKYGQPHRIKSLLDKGIIVSVSPDMTTNPLEDIMIMTSQQADSTENISIEQAVIAYTKTNAYAEYKEKEKGMLVKGMLADLAVLSQDIFTIPKEKLPATRSLLTMIDGKIVYRSKNME
jgi:predicted amidohydrolase YtcJ